jgi:hypothetical protein
MAKNNEPDFGAEVLAAPDAKPMSTNGLQRPTVNATAGQNAARRFTRKAKAAGSPYLSGWNNPEHRALLNLDDTEHGT